MSFVMSNDSFCEGSAISPIPDTMNGETARSLKLQQTSVACCFVLFRAATKKCIEISEKKEYSPDPFARTGIPFGGLWNELKTRIPKYKSDILDGLNLQCLGTIIFMYCASIAQVITFAGLMSEKTMNLIGISETLVSTSAAGVFFALLAGQPMIPIGPTGPLLVFDEILFGVRKICIYCLGERHRS